MDLTSYRTLGRSGLIVSPLALGAMTFGAERWGSGEQGSRAVFDAYVDAGGNFVDTADVYSAGRSEAILGKFLAERGLRDRIVVATKFGWSRTPGTPLQAGNGAKNIRLAIESSLQRFRTDYIDLYWMHVWDHTTPAEEVLQVLTDAIRAGKILYYGFSNTPSWYVAKIATLAQVHGLPGPIGLQYAYSLIDRGVELDLVPTGQAFGLGIVPWSPLAAGLLTGKYGRDLIDRASNTVSLPDKAGEVTDGPSDGRLNGDNPYGSMLFTERNFDIVDALRDIADEIGRPMAQVALSWVRARTGVSSVLVGASRIEQLAENIASLEIDLTSEHSARLDEASALPSINPYFLFSGSSELIFGGQAVQPWR